MKSLLILTLSAISSFAAVFLIITSPHDKLSSGKEFSNPGETDAMRAFDWWYGQRALPNELIPQGAYARAANYLKFKMKKEAIRAVDGWTAQWTSLGPNNVGGRVLAIAVNPHDPNIVWAGAASGGLWKSTTGGTGSPAWTYVNTGFNAVSVSAIAIDTANPDIIYIGTGEISRYKRGIVGTPGARASYGLGILKSTDGGTTWASTGLLFGFPEVTAVQRIVINPQNSRTIFAATSEGTFKSTNAGVTWFFSHSVVMAMDIVINPQDTTILYVSCGNLNSSPGAGIYVSLDAGDNWSQLSNGLPATNFGRTPLSISPTNPSIIYAGVSDGSSGFSFGIYKTTDAGNTWFLVNPIDYTGFAQGWYDNVVAVHPGNPDHVFIAGLDIYESNDGGLNFTDVSRNTVHVDQHAIAFDPTDPSIMYFGCDGGVYKSTNGGSSFINANNGLVTTQFYPGLSVSPTDSNVTMGGLQDNGTVKYGGSLNWASPLGADGGWTAINSSNKNFLYGESQYLVLYRSLNGGASWININSGLPSGSGNTNFIPPFTISYSNPNVLYAGAKNVYKTTNQGSNWLAANGAPTLNGTNIAAISASWTSPDTVMAATGQPAQAPAPYFKIYASTNGGAVWTDVTGPLPYRYPTDIEFDPTDSRIAYVTFSGYLSGHIFRTTNLGQTWTDISSNLPDIPHQAVTVDPDSTSHLYVGTDLGVFHSSNGGTSWEDYNTGMPPAMVLDLIVSRSNYALRAGTFGNGVYERKLPRTPAITIMRPHGGEVWIAGGIENITWSQRFLNTVKIEYSTNDGASWALVADNVPASSPSYAWSVPFAGTTQGLIRISDTPSGLYASTVSVNFSIIANPDVVIGWNMVSVDVAAADPRKAILFPTSISSAFAYSGSYSAMDTLRPGIGFWLKFNMPQHTPHSGDSLMTDTIDVRAGWNMIGALSRPAQISDIIQLPANIVTSNYYGYQAGYHSYTTLIPKRGYWIRTNANGKLVLVSASADPRIVEVNSPATQGLHTLTITDAAGRTESLHFTDEAHAIPLSIFDLPPVGPDGVFDVRYATQRSVEVVKNLSRDCQILVREAIYPITVTWDVHDGDRRFSISSDESRDIPLIGMGSGLFHEASLLTLKSTAAGADEVIPGSFRLDQNYPNPFNPTTDIRYQIADSRFVTLKVYDVLGKEVATLVNEQKEAGAYSLSWDGSNLAGGIYIYRLTAGLFSVTKKMLLVR